MVAPPLYDLKALFGRLADGDEQAFRLVFDAYKRRVQLLAARMLSDVSDTEEIVQETFYRLWANRAGLAIIEDPEAYIFTIAYNSIHNWIRKTVNKEKALFLFVSGKEEPALHGDEVIMGRETTAIIHRAVEALPQQRRLIFKMSRNEGLSHQEIADKLNLSRHTVRNQIFQALRAIRSFLDKAALAWVLHAIINF